MSEAGLVSGAPPAPLDGILFLVPPPYITGEILHVDGGQILGH